MPRLRLALLLAAPLILGCTDGNTGPGNNPDGSTQVLLTDAPFPYDAIRHVNVWVESIAANADADTSENAPGWVTLAVPGRAYDLIDLQSGNTALLGAQKIPGGAYRAIRLVIDGSKSKVVRNNGTEVPVDWQSHAGVTALYAFVEHPLQVPASGGQIVIDFDVGRSFLCGTPDCPRLVFSPVLRAVDGAETGSISGRVLGDTLDAGHPIARASVAVYGGDPADQRTWWVAGTAPADEQGRYHLYFLAPGTYILEATAPTASGYGGAVRTPVVVTAGVETSGQDLLLPLVTPPATPSSVVVYPATATVESGQTRWMVAILFDANGQGTHSTNFDWSSSDPSVATVTTGDTIVTLTGVRAGTATITATSSGISGRATVTVTPAGAPVATVTLTPATATVAVGDSVGLTPTLRDARGNLLTRPVTWTTSDAGIATVTPGGGVWGVAPGKVTITAVAEGQQGTAAVTVVPR